MSAVTSVVIADDHPVFRHGLRRLLQDAEGFVVLGEAADGVEAVRLARELRPDVLLLGLAMPRCSGLDALRELSRTGARQTTLLLTVAVEVAQLSEALELGARGVVLKETATELLLKAIRVVVAGQIWVGRETVTTLLDRAVERAGAISVHAAESPFGSLTPREHEVVAAVLAGDSNRAVAERLGLAEQTVKHHLSRVFEKLGLSSRSQLLAWAARRGRAQ